MAKEDERLLKIVEYTDPYCTWCWGSEPILRRIQETYGDQIKIGYRMGGLVSDISNFYDALNQIGGVNWHRQVAEHWIDASKRHGMPVDERVFYDLKDEFRSTYPASIAFKAAESQDEELAKKYLRRMREGAAAERLPIHRIEVQEKLAGEVGLDVKRFHDDIASGRAEKAFLNDLSDARSRGITGFPTFLIKNTDGKETILHGYQRFEVFEHAFRKLAERPLQTRKPRADEKSILAFVKSYGKVAPREVAEVFNLDLNSSVERLEKLRQKDLISKLNAGNGVFYTSGE